MTLLDQAKRQKRRNNRKGDHDELLEVALAVLKEEVTVTQVARAIYPDKNPTSGYHSQTAARLFKSIQIAVSEGHIRIEMAEAQ